jgi:hypothetical protein
VIDPLWLQAFTLTLAVEVPLAFALAPRGRRAAFVPIAVAAQLLTHPLAWFAFSEGYLGWWAVEGTVLVVETIVYALAAIGWLRASVIAVVANALSAAAGIWLLSG